MKIWEKLAAKTRYITKWNQNQHLTYPLDKLSSCIPMTTMACTSAPLCAQTALFFPAGDEHSPARSFTQKQEKRSRFTTSNTWSCSYLIHWEGVKDMVKSSNGKPKKIGQKRTSVHHLSLPSGHMTYSARPETWQHLQTTMVSPGFWWKNLPGCLLTLNNEKPSKKGWGLTGLPDMEKNVFLFNIRWCSLKFVSLNSQPK